MWPYTHQTWNCWLQCICMYTACICMCSRHRSMYEAWLPYAHKSCSSSNCLDLPPCVQCALIDRALFSLRLIWQPAILDFCRARDISSTDTICLTVKVSSNVRTNSFQRVAHAQLLPSTKRATSAKGTWGCLSLPAVHLAFWTTLAAPPNEFVAS